MTYIIFKAYKKTKYSFYIYFFMNKNDKQILSKTQRKTPERSTQKMSF